ncbi:hypothetical protein [Mycolicibacter sinensis]|uniref:hypothetical protein n=1 Tax=Mycolicibacter sinensis (strain JDM601) TaxID=875328 RepID=UPI0002ED4038|nr:hypothetical protein [Mycolicibacter sinensis]
MEAKGDDWTYRICPVRGNGDHILGYLVSGSDYESGAEFGSSLIDGEPGELTLQGAKALAETDYADRYREAEGFLAGALEHWDGDNGPRYRRNEHGNILFQTDEPVDEVEVVATLKDFFDDYDPDAGRVTVCLRTILSWNDGCVDVLEELRGIVSKGLQRNGSH